MSSACSAFLRSASIFVAAALLSPTVGCSSSGSNGGTADAGSVTLDSVSATRATSVLRFSASLRNTTTKALKTLDTIEVDTGDGPKRANQIQTCPDGTVSPWLLKAGASTTLALTLRSNGPDRQAVEAECVDGSGKPASSSALWEFQTFAVIDTTTTAPVKLAFDGVYEDGSIWSVDATAP